METVRIGKDITFIWQVRKDGRALTAEDAANMCVVIAARNGKGQSLPFEIVEGKIVAVWYGIKQTEVGDYRLTAWYNKGKIEESVVDVVWAVTLSRYTNEETYDELDPVTIELEAGDLTFGVLKGERGISISTIEQTQTSEESGGINIVTITLDDGEQFTFEVRNGLGFTPAQSQKLDELPTNDELDAQFALKADKSVVDAIQALIPSQATESNQLADKDFVNSSIATSTATFRGSFNLVADLSLSVGATHAQIATALGTHIATADNNDYAFVLIPTSDATPTEIAAVERYKFNGTAWAFEYALNNSGFNAAQWAAVNSGITALLVAKLQALPTASELATQFAAKEDVANKVTEIDDNSTDVQYGSAKAVWTAIKNAVLFVKSWVEEKLTSKADRAALENGTLVPKLAENLENWDERGALPTEDEWSGVIRTSGGDESIDSSRGMELLKLSVAEEGLFKATAYKTSGFNLLHDAVAVGSGYFVLVPKLTLGTLGNSDNNNGVIITDNIGQSINTATVYFKAIGNGVPTSVTDGVALTPTAVSYGGKTYYIYTTSGVGYLIFSNITFANTCPHIAWSMRYDEFISPTEASDAGSSIPLATHINALSNNGFMVGIDTPAGLISDEIVRVNATTIQKDRNCGYVATTSLTWTHTDNGDGTYTHSATISAMGINTGAFLQTAAGKTKLEVSGQVVSFTDNNATVASGNVYYVLAVSSSATATQSTHANLEDWGVEGFGGFDGNAAAVVTGAYYQGIPDAVYGALGRLTIQEAKTERVEEVVADINVGDFYELPTLQGQPIKLFGAGTPQEAVVPINWKQYADGGFDWNGQPSSLGQEYINTSVNSGGHYTAVPDGYNLKWINS